MSATKVGPLATVLNWQIPYWAYRIVLYGTVRNALQPYDGQCGAVHQRGDQCTAQAATANDLVL